MAGLAGFDLLVEISNAGLAELVRRNMRFNGVDFTPPTEIVSPIPDEPGATVSFTVSDVRVDLGAPPDGTPAVILAVERLSIVGRSRAESNHSGLAGEIRIFCDVALETPRADASRRVLTMRVRTVRSALRSAPSGVNTLLSVGFTAALMPATRPGTEPPPPPSFELPIRVDPTAAGSLQPLTVRSLQLQIVRNADAARQALALFGRLLPSSAPGGDPRSRTATVVPPGDHAAIEVSPAVFERLVFCPAVQGALRVSDIALLPRTCGNAESVPLPTLPRWSVTRVEPSFANGRIDVRLQARHSSGDGAFDNTVHVEIHGNITLRASGTTITPTWTTDSASGGQTFGWGMWLLGIPFAGLFITMGASAALVSGAVGGNASSFALGSGLVGLDLAAALGPLDATLQQAQIAPDGILMSARLRRRPPPRSLSPTLTLDAAPMTLADEVVDQGRYTSTGCPEGTYEWARHRRTQRLVITPRPALVARPVTYTWELVLGGNPPVALAGGSGVVTRMHDTSTGDRVPSRVERREVAVEWTVDAAGVLTLANRPADGTYHVAVWCTGVDAEGRRVHRSVHADFTGDEIVLGNRTDGTGTWQEDVDACVRGIAGGRGGRGGGAGGMRGLVQPSTQFALPHWILVHRPAPDDVRRFAELVATTMPEQAPLLLQHLESAYSPSYLLAAAARPFSDDAALQLALEPKQAEPGNAPGRDKKYGGKHGKKH